MSFNLSLSPKISVVIPSLNEANYLRHTVDQLRHTLAEESELIVVDDGSTDGSTDFFGPTTGAQSCCALSVWEPRLHETGALRFVLATLLFFRMLMLKSRGVGRNR